MKWAGEGYLQAVQVQYQWSDKGGQRHLPVAVIYASPGSMIRLVFFLLPCSAQTSASPKTLATLNLALLGSPHPRHCSPATLLRDGGGTCCRAPPLCVQSSRRILALGPTERFSARVCPALILQCHQSYDFYPQTGNPSSPSRKWLVKFVGLVWFQGPTI